MTRSRGLVVDVAVLGLLSAGVLSLLDDSFASRTYLVAGLLPVAFLVSLALVMRRFADGVWWYALAALAAYAPLGALVALRRPGPYLVPTLETMTRVLGETVTAPLTLVSTVPPVDPSGSVMLVPYVAGFLAAAPAAWLALATRSALLPVVPFLASLALCISVGVLVPDHLVLRGVTLAIVMVAWAAARARRREALVGAARGSVIAAVTAAVVVTAVSGLVTVLVPDRDETDRVLLRPAGDAVAVVDDAADSVVPRRVGTRDQLLRATGVPEGRRLRFAALDVYDGQAWVPGQESPGAGSAGTFRRIGREVAALHVGNPVRVRVQVRPGYASDWLPVLGELTRLDLDYTDGRTQLSQVRYNQATSSALVVGGVDPRDDYTFSAVLPSDDFGRRDEAAEAVGDQRQPEGEFLDRYLEPFDRAGLSPLQRVLLLARYLRQNGEVRLTGSSSQAPVDLGLRLLGAKRMVATPFQYSAAMALGASRLGVPARVVVGAEPGRGGIVEYDDVESWVELQFADGVWRTLDPDRYVGVHLTSTGEEEAPEAPAAGGWVRDQLDGEDGEIKIPKGTRIELPEGTAIEGSTDPWVVVATVLAALAGALLLAWLAVPVAKVLRRRRRRSSGGWSGTYVNGWQEVLDTARDRGTPVPDTWSRVAQARGLGVGLDLAREADAAVFAPSATPDEERTSYWRRTQEVRRSLLTDLSWQRRAWALLNPASLVAGWRRRRSADGSGAGPVRHEDRRPRGEQPAGA
jgi:hypothetical protein